MRKPTGKVQWKHFDSRITPTAAAPTCRHYTFALRFECLKKSQGSTDWLPKPCESGAQWRSSLCEPQCRPTTKSPTVQPSDCLSACPKPVLWNSCRLVFRNHDLHHPDVPITFTSEIDRFPLRFLCRVLSWIGTDPFMLYGSLVQFTF